MAFKPVHKTHKKKGFVTLPSIYGQKTVIAIPQGKTGCVYPYPQKCPLSFDTCPSKKPSRKCSYCQEVHHPYCWCLHTHNCPLCKKTFEVSCVNCLHQRVLKHNETHILPSVNRRM